MVKIVCARVGRLWNKVLDIVKASLKDNEPCIVLVPEQYTLQAEMDIVKDLNLKGLMKVQVMSPSRLSFRVFERAGSTNPISLDEQGQRMLVAKALYTSQKKLNYFGTISENPGFINSLTTFIVSLKEQDIDKQALIDVAAVLDDKNFTSKISDIATVYDAYEKLLAQSCFTDAQDTQQDMLSRLKFSQVAKEAYCVVYGFDTISVSLKNTLLGLGKHCEKLIVTLVADKYQQADGPAFEQPLKSAQRLQQAFKDSNIQSEFSFLDYEPLNAPVEIQYLEKYFLALNKPVYDEKLSTISIYAGSTPYKEAEYTAYMTRLHLLNGTRPEDIVIICSNLSTYAGILSGHMVSFEVPYYIAQKSDFSAHGAVRVIIHAIDIIRDNYRLDDMIAYMSTGYSSISDTEANLLRNYAVEYGIKGKLWHEEFNRGEEQIRLEIEPVRKKLIAPLNTLHIGLKESKTAIQSIDAVIDFLYEIGVPEKLEQDEQQFLLSDIDEAADTTRQIWKNLTDSFEQMKLVFGDERIPIVRFSGLLSAAIEGVQLATLPARLGCVQIGALGNLIPGKTKIVFVLGLNDGILSADTENPLLPDELEKLENSLKIEPLQSTDDIEQLKLLSLWKALSAPEEKLYMSYSMSEESGEVMQPLAQLKSLKHMFPQLHVQGGLITSEMEKIPPISPSSALKILASKQDFNNLSKEWKDSIDFLFSSSKWRNKAFAALNATFDTENNTKISNSKANELFNLSSMSVSRIQSYASCPFRHFVEEGLRPKEQKEWKVDNRDRGNFFHAALEKFSHMAVQEKDYPEISKDRCNSLMQNAGEAIMLEQKNLPLGDSNRNIASTEKYLTACKETAWTLTRSFQRSAFMISKVEQSFGKLGGLMPVALKLSSGEVIYLSGIIDRVDEYLSDKETYIRIIDYKSGSAVLRAEDIYAGLQLQLLIYLNALSNQVDFVPAGIFYQKVTNPLIKEEGEPISHEVLQVNKDKELMLSGVVLNDQYVISLMDDGEPLLSLGKLFTNKGEPIKGKMLASKEEIQQLMDFAMEKSAKIVEDIKKGNITASPLVNKYGSGPCDYCDYVGICRCDGLYKLKSQRVQKSMGFDELLYRTKK